jgi:hypothetical protein
MGWTLRSVAPAGIAALACVGLAVHAGAATLVVWDLASATGQQADVGSLAANVGAGPIDEVGVVQWPNTGQDGFVAARGWSPDPLAYDPARYYGWSVTAAPGFEIRYGQLELALFRGIGGGGHGAERWDLHASVDGFASSDLALGTFDLAGQGADVQTAFAADLSALGRVGGTVTFRLYGYDQTYAQDYSGLGNDDGTWLIYGTGLDPTLSGVVFPDSASSGVAEPGAAALVGLSLAGFVLVSLVSERRP